MIRFAIGRVEPLPGLIYLIRGDQEPDNEP
jgi:hypothetical protein